MSQPVPNKDLHVLITGGGLSGNKGAMAMTQVAIEQIRKLYPTARIGFFSKYPSQDIPNVNKYDVTLYPAPPQKMVTTTALRSLLIWALKPWFKSSWMHDSILKVYAQTDIVLDVSGITFSDAHEWRGLGLSIGWILPAIATGRPMIKLSQAIGPFDTMHTKFWAKRMLKHCPVIVTRGRQSEQNVKELFPEADNIFRCDDIAFLLSSAPDEQVDGYLTKKGFPAENYIAISPSAVVDRKAKQKGIRRQYRRAILALVEHIRENYSEPVLFVPHAWPQTGRGREDAELCAELHNELQSCEQVYAVQDDLDCAMLKGIIAKSTVLVSCRFHAMIAALSSVVPTMVIGWGHKYKEIMEQFKLEPYCFDFTQTDTQALCQAFDAMYSQNSDHRKTMTQCLPDIKASAQQNFKLVNDYVQQQVMR